MKTDIFLITLLVTLLCLGSFSSARAQVVTPSLDPTEPIVLPAAAGWRQTETVGVSSFERTGSRSGPPTDQAYYEFLGTGATFFFNFRMGESLAVEGYSSNEAIAISKDVYQDGFVVTGTAESRFAITLSHEEFAVFGLGLHTDQVSGHFFDNMTLDEFDETTVETKTIPSLSIKFGDSFYLGGGLERVKESSDTMVDNHWSNVVTGLAFMTGSPDTTMYRFEYSLSSSPKAVSAPKQGKDESYHPNTTTSRINLELKIEGLVLIASTKTTIKTYDDDFVGPLEKIDTIVNSKFGVLLAPMEGPILGFIFHNDSENFYFDDKFESFEIKVAYAF